jgi:MEMO1 family protein
MEISIRKPAVAGRFYPGVSSSLNSLIDQLLEAEKGKIDYQSATMPIVGGIVPHAGMVFSGYQAVHFYEIVGKSSQEYDTVVIVNPNHSGRGSGLFNTSNYQYWETPLGKIEADLKFIEALTIESNNQAHDNEHSGEVQLPFMQKLFSFSFKLVMITMNIQNSESSEMLAGKILHAVKQTNRKILLIASSDFNHYESPETGYCKDQYLVDRIVKFDINGVYSEVKKHHVTACGYGPIMTLLSYAKLVDDNPSISILKRGHSGEVHPSEEVVDYISFLVSHSNNG